MPLPVESMGRPSDQCYWCKEAPDELPLLLPDGLPGGLCPKSLDAFDSPDGKPPQPDARARLATLLAKVLDEGVAARLATFVHDWTEP